MKYLGLLVVTALYAAANWGAHPLVGPYGISWISVILATLLVIIIVEGMQLSVWWPIAVVFFVDCVAPVFVLTMIGREAQGGFLGAFLDLVFFRGAYALPVGVRVLVPLCVALLVAWGAVRMRSNKTLEPTP